MNRLAQSNYKKLEVFGLHESNNQLVLNLRIEYDNGCVINLTVSQEKISGSCEVFQKTERIQFDIHTPLYIQYPHLNQEYTAINNFIRLIQNRDKKANSFDSLLNGVQIVHEIKEHLRFNGIDF